MTKGSDPFVLSVCECPAETRCSVLDHMVILPPGVHIRYRESIRRQTDNM